MNDTKRRLVDEINEGLRQQTGLTSVVRKAAHLAALCDEPEYRMVFEIHLCADQFFAAAKRQDERTAQGLLTRWPDQQRQPRWDPYDAVIADRQMPNGTKISTHSIAQLEDFAAFAESMRALLGPRDIHDAMTLAGKVPAADEVLDRIRNRLSRFVAQVEADAEALESPDARAERTMQSLRATLSLIDDEDAKGYLREAVQGYEHGLYRASIVMAWCLAFAVVRDWLFREHVAELNAVLAGWKKPIAIAKVEDFESLSERVVLDTARSAKALTKGQHKILVQLLDQRNDFGHPSGRVASSVVAEAFIQQVVDEVLQRYVSGPKEGAGVIARPGSSSRSACAEA